MSFTATYNATNCETPQRCRLKEQRSEGRNTFVRCETCTKEFIATENNAGAISLAPVNPQ